MELTTASAKAPFNIPRMFQAIRKAVQPYPKATLFELRDQGFDSVFEQLVACVLSIRTYDEVSLVAAQRLFAKARTPQKIVDLDLEELAALITPCTFPFQKAHTLKKISEIVVNEHGGDLPADFDTLIDLPGVGPKCAGLTLGIATQQAYIGVDIHVHRVTNRWGYVHASTPEKTMAALQKVLPKSKWIEINELLVPFGKHICLGNVPKCSVCPVLKYCHQVGVTKFQ
jgi:endonuclease-3